MLIARHSNHVLETTLLSAHVGPPPLLPNLDHVHVLNGLGDHLGPPVSHISELFHLQKFFIETNKQTNEAHETCAVLFVRLSQSPRHMIQVLLHGNGSGMPSTESLLGTTDGEALPLSIFLE